MTNKNNRLSWACALVIASAIPAGCFTATDSKESGESVAQARSAVEKGVGDKAALAEAAEAEPGGGCGEPAPCNPEINLENYRVSPSLVLSRQTQSIAGQPDAPILDKVFPLHRVVDQLLNFAGMAGNQSADEWLARLWDTQNQSSGVFNESFQAHCDDNGTTINGFPIDCPRPEGQLANAVSVKDFAPIGVFNRFDLAPKDGAHCGEYRVVYAMRSENSAGVGGRNFIIFEGQLPNPNPDCGIEACRPVVNFWANLSNLTDQGQIAEQLNEFYFKGIAGFQPVVRPEHYGLGVEKGGEYGNGGGQIRTNQFVDSLAWQLREFQLNKGCDDNGCRLLAHPVSVKNNPFFDLFDANSSNPLAPSFQAAFPNQVPRLAIKHPNPITNLNLIAMSIENEFNAGQSTAEGNVEAYLAPFQAVPTSQLHSDIQVAINNLPFASPLTPDEVVQRAEAQSCQGCHENSNGNSGIGDGLTWPSSNKFTHVDEDGKLSQALVCVFLPHRQAVGVGFLQACGENPDPKVPAVKQCTEFDPELGYGKKKAAPTPEELEAAEAAKAAASEAASTEETIGGGSKVN